MYISDFPDHPKLNKLAVTLDKVGEALGSIASARGIPQDMADRIKSLEIKGGWHKLTDAEKSRIDVYRGRMAEAEKIVGEMLRDETFRDAMLQIEALRCVLSGLAADAVIELGAVIRDLEAEMKGQAK